MRIFVFADTHGNTEGVDLVLSKSKPDLLIHLGDSANDAMKIKHQYPDIEMMVVRSNDDDQTAFAKEKQIHIGNKNIYLTHGDQLRHGRDVTSSSPESEIVTYAIQRDIDIVLHGHIHTPALSLERGIFVMNPGSAALKPGFNPTFGLIELNENNVIGKIISIELFKY